MLHTILLALAPVFFVLGLGYAAGKLHIVDNHQLDGFNVLVMNFALPASLFVATSSASRAEMLDQAPLFAISAAVMLVLWVISYGFRHILLKASIADASLQAVTVAVPNFAGVGLPIAVAMLGPSGAVPVAVALASSSVLVLPLTLALLEMHRSEGAALGPRARVLNAVSHALTRPVVLAPVLGIVVSLSDVRPNAIIESSLTLIGQAAAGVALFLTGLILSAQAFRFDWKLAVATGAADVVRPLTAVAVVALLPLSPDVAKTTILLAAIPSGFFGILFAVSYRHDSATPGSMVFASTVFSIVTLPIVIAVLFPH